MVVTASGRNIAGPLAEGSRRDESGAIWGLICCCPFGRIDDVSNYFYTHCVRRYSVNNYFVAEIEERFNYRVIDVFSIKKKKNTFLDQNIKTMFFYCRYYIVSGASV